MSGSATVRSSLQVPLVEVVSRLSPEKIIGEVAGVVISSVTYDHRTVTPGALHCCLPGTRVDGHDFAPAAARAGAVAFVCERPLADEAGDIVQLVVGPGGARPAMAVASCVLWSDPASSLKTVGVTGTNGKTTTTYFLRSVLEAHGWPTGVIGTLGGARTTPEAPDLQRALAHARDSGRMAVALEVTSHALSQNRLDGYRHDVAVFTNLSQDHLDYHGTMESYFAAKERLFTPEHALRAVVNADDPYGRRLIEAAAIPTSPFSLAEAEGLEVGLVESRFRLEDEPCVSAPAVRSTSATPSPRLRPPGRSACPRRPSPRGSRRPRGPRAGSRWCPTSSGRRSSWTTPTRRPVSPRCSARQGPRPRPVADG